MWSGYASAVLCSDTSLGRKAALPGLCLLFSSMFRVLQLHDQPQVMLSHLVSIGHILNWSPSCEKHFLNFCSYTWSQSFVCLTGNQSKVCEVGGVKGTPVTTIMGMYVLEMLLPLLFFIGGGQGKERNRFSYGPNIIST